MASNRAQILISAVDQTKTAFDSISGVWVASPDTAKSVNGVLANLGVAVSVAGLTAMVKSAIDTGDALDEMSQRVGVSVETLSVWKPAAEQSGVSGESFEKGLRKLSTTMLEAATGSEDAARGFSAVGVEFKNQDGTLRPPIRCCSDLAERFKAMPDGAEKPRWPCNCSASPGRADPVPESGRDGINELAAEMQALGVQMSSETAAQAGNFNDALDKLKLATTSIGNQIIASLLPALNDMAGGMVESAKQGGTLRVILMAWCWCSRPWRSVPPPSARPSSPWAKPLVQVSRRRSKRSRGNTDGPRPSLPTSKAIWSNGWMNWRPSVTACSTPNPSRSRHPRSRPIRNCCNA